MKTKCEYDEDEVPKYIKKERIALYLLREKFQDKKLVQEHVEKRILYNSVHSKVPRVSSL